METPCQRPKTLEGRRPDLERGKNATGSVVCFVLVFFSFLNGCVYLNSNKTSKSLLRHQITYNRT